MLDISDVLYLVVLSVVSQLGLIPEFAGMVLTLPVFIIIPCLVGSAPPLRFFANGISELSAWGRLIGRWFLGTAIIVAVALGLDCVGLFSITAFLFAIIVILSISRIRLFKNGFQLTGFVGSLERGSSKRIMVIVTLLLGLIPPTFQLQIWPFPLKFQSDGFEVAMVSQYMMQHNSIPFQAYSHFPLESIMLSFTSALFKVQPLDYLWGLPFIVYPMLAVGVFLLAERITGNLPLAVFSSGLSSCFLGGFSNADDYFFVIARNVVGLLLPFVLYLMLRRGPKGSHAIRRVVMIMVTSVLLFSLAYLAIIPSANHLPSVVLVASLAVAMLLPTTFARNRSFTLFLIPVLLLVAISLLWVFANNAPSPSRSDLITQISLVGTSSACVLALLSQHASNLNDFDVFDISCVAVLLFAFLELGLVVVTLICISIALYEFLTAYGRFLRVTRYAAGLALSLLSVYFGAYFGRGIVSLGHNLPLWQRFSDEFAPMQDTFTSVILALFTAGCFLILLRGRALDQIVVVFGLSILALYFWLGYSNTTRYQEAFRLFDLLPFFIAFSAAYTFLPLYRLAGSSRSDSEIEFVKHLTRVTPSRIKNARPYFIAVVLLLVLTPAMEQPSLSFQSALFQIPQGPSTYSVYEYDAGLWMQRNVPANSVILTDTFTLLILEGLSGNVVASGYRMIYDTAGNTHSIFTDSRTLAMIKALFLAPNTSLSRHYMTEILNLYQSNCHLNIEISGMNQCPGNTLYVVFSGRTTSWVNSTSYANIPWPQPFAELPGYSNFFNGSNCTLGFQEAGQILVYACTV